MDDLSSIGVALVVLAVALAVNRWVLARRSAACILCERSADAVSRVVAGPRGFICADCVRSCQALLDSEPSAPPDPDPFRPPR